MILTPSALVLLALTHIAGDEGPTIINPDGTVRDRVKITAQLEDPAGNPWTGVVRFTAQSADGFRTDFDLTPSPSGSILAFAYLKQGFSSPISVRLWGDPASTAVRGGDPFLAASEGLAAFASVLPSAQVGGGFQANAGLMVITPPPLVGTVNITNPQPIPLSLFLRPPTSHGSVGGGNEQPTSTLAASAGSFSIYSWGLESYWSYELTSSSDLPIGTGQVRRSATVSTTLETGEITVTADTDLMVYPDAFVVILVPSSLNQPDSSPDGSAIPYSDLEEQGIVTVLPSGSLAASITAVEGSWALQLWSFDPAVHDDPVLSDHAVIPPGSGAHSIDFP